MKFWDEVDGLIEGNIYYKLKQLITYTIFFSVLTALLESIVCKMLWRLVEKSTKFFHHGYILPT